MAGAAHGIPALIVGQDEDDIGPGRGGHAGDGSRRPRQQAGRLTSRDAGIRHAGNIAGRRARNAVFTPKKEKDLKLLNYPRGKSIILREASRRSLPFVLVVACHPGFADALWIPDNLAPAWPAAGFAAGNGRRSEI
jgi:hypothetical protein